MQAEVKRTRKPRKRFNARMKAQSVLLLWNGSRKASELCREMSISWGVLSQWQERAMEGMLAYLEPKRREESGTPSLTGRLKELLDRKATEREIATVPARQKEKPLEQEKAKDPA
jgi:transposase-like protein